MRRRPRRPAIGLCAAAFALTTLHASAEPAFRAAAIDCRPALPYFCRNIHAGCSGRTQRPARPFRLAFDGEAARMIAPDLSRLGRIEPAEAPAFAPAMLIDYLLIRLDGGRDWIRIEADNRYSLRVYDARGEASMSHGLCAPVDPS